MTGLPPGEFSLISLGTKIPGQVTQIANNRAKSRYFSTAVLSIEIIVD